MILKRAGISKGGMYHYFESKNDILEEVLNYCFDFMTPVLEEIKNDKDMSAVDKLELLFSDNKIKISNRD